MQLNCGICNLGCMQLEVYATLLYATWGVCKLTAVYIYSALQVGWDIAQVASVILHPSCILHLCCIQFFTTPLLCLLYLPVVNNMHFPQLVPLSGLQTSV